MEERYYIKIGNCYITFLGLSHEPTMKADYHKASPFLTMEEAKIEANKRGLKNYKIVKKYFKIKILSEKLEEIKYDKRTDL